MTTQSITRSILLIDDEASIRELVQVCLNDLVGWNVVSVASAQEGLQALSKSHPDAILLDVLMPGMDAITFIHKLHQLPIGKTIPILFLSVRANWFTPQQLQELGVIEAIAKPFNPITLPDRIATALGWEV